MQITASKQSPSELDTSPATTHAAAEHKARVGVVRIWHASSHSLQGLSAAWPEKAFRFETFLAMVLLPASFWLGAEWAQVAVLAGSVVAVLVVELLNTAVEAVVDRVGTEWHLLAKKAKDIASAAVFLALLFCGAVWTAALWARYA